MLKTCTKCKIEKPVDQFRIRNKEKGTRQCWCKECFSSYEKKVWNSNPNRRKANKDRNDRRIERNRQFVWDYLKLHGCINCGNNNPIVLEFDHIIRDTKRYNISSMIRSYLSIDSIKKEIEKCQIRCANCHRLRTAEQFEWYKNIKR